MNVTQVDAGGSRASASRRMARVLAVVLAVGGVALLVHAIVTGARLELLLVALGLAAAAALIGLLAASPTSDVVVRHKA
jgi:hypothetical protein